MADDEQAQDRVSDVPEDHLAFSVEFLVHERFAPQFAISLHSGNCIQAHRVMFMRPTGVPAPLEHYINEIAEPEAPEGA